MKMDNQVRSKAILTVAFAATLVCSVNASAAVDVEVAKGLARENNCFKCHVVEKEKDGLAYKKFAGKYRGKAGAEDRLVTQVSTGEKGKFADGHE
jgi:cytochrome c